MKKYALAAFCDDSYAAVIFVLSCYTWPIRERLRLRNPFVPLARVACEMATLHAILRGGIPSTFEAFSDAACFPH